MSSLRLLIDGNNLAHRAKHTHAELQTSTGLDSGVVYGSLRLLRTLIERFNPAALGVVFDGGTREKTDIDPRYKAHRQLPRAAGVEAGVPQWDRGSWRQNWRRRPRRPAVWDPEAAFHVQLRDLAQLLRAAGVPTLRLDGVEADSVIGALALLHTGQEAPTIIVSSDYDFHQLVNDRVRVFDDMKKKLWDIAAVKAHYRLREPREVSTYKALVGDTSDGVKGVYQCGPVKARKVCAVLRRLVREAPYIHRLSHPPNALTRRVIRSLTCARLVLPRGLLRRWSAARPSQTVSVGTTPHAWEGPAGPQGADHRRSGYRGAAA